jgi:hypothetical protein
MDHHADDDAHPTDDAVVPEPELITREADAVASDRAATVPPLRPPDAPPAGWSRGDLIGIVIAAVGGAAIVLTILVPRAGHRDFAPTVSSAPVAAATSTAPSRSVPAAPAAGVTVSRGWQQATEWVGLHRRSIAFEVEADRAVRAWMRQVRPVLVVRCLRGSLDAFVVTGSASSIEPGRPDHTVRLAFDDEPPVVEHWADSAENDGLFAPDGAAFLERLSRTRTLRVAFTPHNAPEAEAVFGVTGAEAIVGPLERYCHQR